MKPLALVFDAYGTLFDVHAVVQRCESFWPGQGAKLSQLWRAKQLEWTWQRSLMRRYVPFSRVTREALGYACETLGLALDESRISALTDEYLDLAAYPDVPGALGNLQAGGYRLAILTNGSPDMIDPLVRNRGMQRLFAAVLSVDALQIYKPAPEVYEFASRRLGVAAGDVGFVSSNCWDALGAKSFGFRVWWINRAGAPVDRLGFEPDGILSGLGDLPAALA
ncbi:MAG: haloacid dehalogenase type II [Betaproteobacteria bacterium]|nr:haloacid dehalogenase type II [Betaproteobacteria bacterium]